MLWCDYVSIPFCVRNKNPKKTPKKPKAIIAFIVKERNRQIIYSLCSMTTSEAATKRCSINRRSIIYYNTKILLEISLKIL